MTSTLRIVAGIDTHGAAHHVAVLDEQGKHVGDKEFPASAAGYSQIINYLTGHGQVVEVRVESTGSYGAKLTRRVRLAGLKLIEVNSGDRASRTLRGNTGQLDAYAAAAAVLSARAQTIPKARNGIAEAIRVYG